MKSVNLTGTCGLIGSACVEKFMAEGRYVYGIDNRMRKATFGKDADTRARTKAGTAPWLLLTVLLVAVSHLGREQHYSDQDPGGKKVTRI